MISDEDISIYINAGKNSNTVEKTKNDLTRLNNWRKISLKDANPVPIEQIEADELNKLLRSFFLTIDFSKLENKFYNRIYFNYI